MVAVDEEAAAAAAGVAGHRETSADSATAAAVVAAGGNARPAGGDQLQRYSVFVALWLWSTLAFHVDASWFFRIGQKID